MESLAGKHLVIFGCGYVGAAAAARAVAAKMRVTALTRNPVTAAQLRAQGIEAVVADLASDSWHSVITRAPDYTLDCVSSGGGGIEAYRRSYLHGMESILTWAQKHGGSGTFVYTSSTSVYAQGDGARVDETSPAVADSERAQLLLETEGRLRFSPSVCQRWFVLRLAGIYGPDRHHLLEQVRAGEVAGSGEHHLNLIHRSDIVAAVFACFAAPPSVGGEIFNVADDAAATKATVVRWLAERLGLPAPRFTGRPAGGRRAVTPDRVILNGKIKTNLGWRPQFPTFREGYGSLLSH